MNRDIFKVRKKMLKVFGNLCYYFLGNQTHSGTEIKYRILLYKTARNETGYGEAGWWSKQFTNADVDQNGLLNFDELKE